MSKKVGVWIAVDQQPLSNLCNMFLKSFGLLNISLHTQHRGSNSFTGLLQQPCEHIMYLSMRLQREKHTPNSLNATHLSVLPAKPKLTQEERMNE